MSPVILYRVLVSALIVVLHTPLIYYVYRLYGSLEPFQGIADLPAMSLMTLAALVVAPHILLSWFNIRWNPPWARSNEIDPWDCRPPAEKEHTVTSAAARITSHH